MKQSSSISQPLPGSREGYETRHEVLLEGRRIGIAEVSYSQKEDIKIFRKYVRRKLRVGQPFNARVLLNADEGFSAENLGRDALKQIVEALLDRFKGLEARDIYMAEIKQGKIQPVGRGHEI